VNARPGVGVYRQMLRLYPRRFRDEYGADMALLFAEQLRDERAARVWVRSVVDLAITVPTRHLEEHMNRPPSPLVPLLFAIVSVAGACVALVGGTGPATLAVGLAVAVGGAALSAVSWRRTRPLTADALSAAHWWKFIAGGVLVLGAVIAVTTATGEVDDSVWLPLMLTVVAALVSVVVGLVMALVHLSGARPSRAPS
jgi:hypothetical protein